MKPSTDSAPYLSTGEAGRLLGFSRVTCWRVCKSNPGFGISLGASFKIPRDHVERVLRGEKPAEIAAAVRAASLGQSQAA